MIRKVFSETGALAKAIHGFVPRQPQTDMAIAVDTAIRDQGQLVVEAGTGTGKTYAYLAPVLLSGKKSYHQYRFEKTCKSSSIIAIYP